MTQSAEQWSVTLRRADGSSARHASAPSDLRHRRQQHSGDAGPARACRRSPARWCIPATFKNAEQWRGRKALVLGTGTSGHDVAQELHAHGADVTIIQRSKTYVVSLQEAQSVYAIYSEGIPFEDCDLLATSMPYPVLRRSYQLSTAARPRGRQGVASTGLPRAASGCGTAKTRPASR